LEEERKGIRDQGEAHELETLHAIVTGIGRSLDPEEVYGEIVKAAVEELGFTIAYLTLYDEQAGALKLRAIYPQDGRLERTLEILQIDPEDYAFPILSEKGPHFARYLEGEMVISDSYYELVRPNMPKEAAAAVQALYGVKRIVNIPLQAKGRLLGSLLVATPQEAIEERKLRLLRTLAAQAAVAIERAKLYQKTVKIVGKYEKLLENELVGIYIIQDGKFKYVNRGVGKIFGYRPEEMIERLDLLDLVHPEDQQLVLEKIQERIEGGKEFAHYTFRGVKKNGEIFDCEVLGSRIDYEGRPAIQGILHDISLVKGAERLRRSLLKIAGEILASYDLEHILRRVAQAIVEHSPFQRAAVSLYDTTAEDPLESPVMKIYSAGLTAEEEQRLIGGGGMPPQYRQAAFSEEFRLGHSYYIPHDRTPWGPEEGVPGRVSLDGWHPDDFLFIPLRTKRGIIGHISVDDPTTPRAPTLEMLEPLELFAELAALAVERAARLTELQQHKEWLRGSYHIGQELAHYRTLKELLGSVLEILGRELRYDYGEVLLQEGDELVVKAAESTLANREMKSGSRFPLDRGITGWVTQHKQPVLVNDVAQDPRYLMGYEKIRSELAVPIQLGDELLGVLNIESTTQNRFRPEDQEFLSSVAAQLAVAIAELRSREELKEISVRDPLTGLYNRRYFNEIVEQELERSRRYGHHLTFLMADLDDFREVNTRYGHLKGDEVLREIAELLEKNVRAADMVFRYGGDEFLILMPETDREAQESIGRLQQAVEGWNKKSGLDLKIGISIGVSSWSPKEERRIEEVLEEADQRMYQAKTMKERF